MRIKINLFVRSISRIDDVRMVRKFNYNITVKNNINGKLKKKIYTIFTIILIFQEYSVQITFREDWDDIRLAYDDYNGTSCSKIMT